MPDVFVPYDTTRFTDLHRQLINKGILNQFTLRYTDDHRQELKAQYQSEEEFIKSFSVTDEVVEDLLRLARQEKFNPTDEQLAADRSVLKLQLKAYIARDLYATAAYYKVMAPENEPLQEALRILSDKKLKKRYGLE